MDQRDKEKTAFSTGIFNILERYALALAMLLQNLTEPKKTVLGFYLKTLPCLLKLKQLKINPNTIYA